MKDYGSRKEENPLAQYSISQLLRLLTQFSCTTDVEQELHRRLGGPTVTVPVRLLVEAHAGTETEEAKRHYL